MKKLYTITLMLVMMLTSNLFSQVALPYATTSGQFFIDLDNSVTFDNVISQNFTYTEDGFFVQDYGGMIVFRNGSNSSSFFEGKSILWIEPSNFNIGYKVNYSWSPNGTVELLGSTDNINFFSINSNVSNNTPLTFDNTSNNYTYIMIKFISSGTGIGVSFSEFNIYPSTTSVETTDVSNNYNVYSYNKNLIVKSNDFQDYTVTVYNLNGQVVLNKTTNGNNEFTLNVSNGMYIVNVNDGTESFNKKVVMQ